MVKDLVHCPMTWAKTTLLLLNLRFDNWLEPSLQHTGVNVPGDPEECDPPEPELKLAPSPTLRLGLKLSINVFVY